MYLKLLALCLHTNTYQNLWLKGSLKPYSITILRRFTNMKPSRRYTALLSALFALLVMSTTALADIPGLPLPAASEASDQKAGALLFYNAYTSSATAANSANTRINITNSNDRSGIFVH